MHFPNTVTMLSSAEDERTFCNSSNTSNKVMIFFGSDYCPHCHDMKDFYSSLPSKYPSCKFGYVETSQIEVDNLDGVPVFVLYRNCVPVDKVVGASPDKVTNLLTK